MADEDTQTSSHEPDPRQRPARLALYLGGAMLLAGAVVMYLGYDGAAKSAIPQAQTPYVISGGLFGLGLMALGGIGLAVYVLLQVQGDLRSDLTAMREAMESLAEAMSHRMFESPLSALPSTNGYSTVLVARGASSFHRAECRLVERVEHTRALPREEADREGLVPCRICKP